MENNQTNKPKTFEERVRAMSAAQIILTMVVALRDPCVKIDMYTFGEVKNLYVADIGEDSCEIEKVCYGCAATNMLCKIAGVSFRPDNIEERDSRAEIVNSDYEFLDKFETAIDSLRRGNITEYNVYAERGRFAQIKRPNDISVEDWEKDIFAPRITNDMTYMAEALNWYERFAETQKTFEEKVRSMSAKEIILAMVEGLRNPRVEVQMRTFGQYDRGEDKCYGCAATNAICVISGVTFNGPEITLTKTVAEYIGAVSIPFVDNFENAINDLRTGDFDDYNRAARRNGFATIVIPDWAYEETHDFYLSDNYTKEDLALFERLAHSQPEKGQDGIKQ